MEVVLIKEHEDGSATYKFDMSDEERNSLLTLGIITALERGIKDAEKYVAEMESLDEQSPTAE